MSRCLVIQSAVWPTVVAEYQHEKEQEWERQRKEEEEARRRKQEAETRRAELEARRHDLESRMLDLQESEAIRHFIQMVREDADRRGVDLEADEEIRGWVAWVEGLAGDLERNAIQTLKQRRHRTKEPSTGGYRSPDETENQASERGGSLEAPLHLGSQVTFSLM